MQRSRQLIFNLPISNSSSKDYLSLTFVSCILTSGREKLPSEEQKAVDGNSIGRSVGISARPNYKSAV